MYRFGKILVLLFSLCLTVQASAQRAKSDAKTFKFMWDGVPASQRIVQIMEIATGDSVSILGARVARTEPFDVIDEKVLKQGGWDIRLTNTDNKLEDFAVPIVNGEEIDADTVLVYRFNVVNPRRRFIKSGRNSFIVEMFVEATRTWVPLLPHNGRLREAFTGPARTRPQRRQRQRGR